jgi:hypothetical protein
VRVVEARRYFYDLASRALAQSPATLRGHRERLEAKGFTL